MSELSLPAALRRAALEHADRTAVVDAGTTMTFAELHERVRACAAGYVALGLAPGDRVGVWAPNSWQWQVAALAVSYAGGVLVPINTRYTGHEAADLLHRTQARLLIVHDGFLGRDQVAELRAAADTSIEGPVVPGLPELTAVVSLVDTPGLTPWADLDDHDRDLAAAEARADAVDPDDIADILFTSGTTGRSKGVVTAHRQTIAAAAVWARIAQITPHDRYLVVNPYFHSFGYKIGLVVSLLTGCSVVPMPVFDVDVMLELVESERITVLPGAPAIFGALLEAPGRSAADLSSLRIAVTGAASIPVRLIERMQSELSFDTVLTAYGMTECVVATMCRPGDPDALVAATCGRAVADLELQVTDPETGAPLPAGTEGEIRMRGPMVMQGYLDDPEATAAAIDPDGWLHSGDVGTVDEHGYLRITDRLKDMYISGGFNVYPAEVEQALARLDGVVDVGVVGVPDERLGEVGCAFVVRRQGTELSESDVIAFARQRLANFKAPRQVVFVDALPRNLAGKILKNDLRALTSPGAGREHRADPAKEN
ncbi:FadD3 family acyl-CoA ligase [Nocardioides limicola]|uniref:FadD3 family acyl-CoA ligase n=1 Tax=Nocardioides limicola TaxID=2803368 RepID=UPI00193BB3FE|nr:FadD3 family acyl-CoA ligase [Nocardioides sp. DJM-14]